MPHPLDAAHLRARVQECVDAELAAQSEVLAEVGPDAQALLTAVGSLLSGGKRLRAASCTGATGRPASPTPRR